MIQKMLQYKLIRYALTGGIATGIHVSVAYSYIYFIDSSIFFSNVLGFVVAFFFSYTIQSIYVFKHSINLNKAFKYFSVQFSALLAAILVSNYIPIDNSYLKTVIVVLVLPLITYIIHKFWTFQEHNQD